MDLLPAKIQHYVEGLNYTSDDIGMSKAQVRIYDDYVLKVEKERPKLAKMVEVMRWIEGKLPTPRVIATEVEDGKVSGFIDPDELFVKLGIEPNWEKIRYYILLDELF